MTEAELMQLEQNLTQLAAINLESQQESAQLKAQLASLKQQLTMLKMQLAKLKQTSVKQEQLLQTANESLEKYAKEEKAKQQNLKRQRNIAYIIAAGLFIYAVK